MPVSPFKIIHKGNSIEVIPFPFTKGLQHVYKHFLNLNEKWNMYSENIIDKKKELDTLKCRGEYHGTLCPNFQKCYPILENLYPQYFGLIEEAIREGTSPKEPFHTHNEEFTQYFVGHTGMWAITRSLKNNLVVISGYRPLRKGFVCNTEIEFLDNTVRYIIENKKRIVKKWCGVKWLKGRFK